MDTDNAILKHAMQDMRAVPTASHMKTAPETLTGQIVEAVGDHLKHRLNPWTIATEITNHVLHKLIPQGADEVANALYSGSAYLPWPGNNGPAPIPPPETEAPLFGVGPEFERDAQQYAQIVQAERALGLEHDR